MRVGFLVLFHLTLAALMSAQNIPTGSVLGTVKDAADAAVPGAKVTLTNTDTGISQSAESNTFGQYLFPNVLPGNYQVSIESSGFKRYVQPLVVRVAMSTTVDAKLEIGAVQETVNVTGQPSLLETSTGSLGTLVTGRMTQDLPVSGNNPLRLFQLIPGMVQASAPSRVSLGNTGLVAGAGEVAYNTVNGSDRGANNFMLDGASNSRGNQPGYAATTAQTLEFNVMTNTYDAQYGRVQGAILNVVTRGGGNQFAGQLYEFLQNDALNAYTFFQKAKSGQLRKTPDRYNQFGGTIGGPISRDRTFFFFNYEGIRASRPQLGMFTVPTALERQGDFSQTKIANKPLQIHDPFSTRPDPNRPGQFIRDPFPNNTIPASKINSVPSGILRLFVPLPNFGENRYLTSAPPRDRFALYSIRLDHNISDRNRLFGRFSITRLEDEVYIGLNQLAPELNIYANAAIGFTSNLSPSTVLQIFGGWMTSRLKNEPPLQTDLVALGFAPSFERLLHLKNALPEFNISAGMNSILGANGRWDNQGPASFNANLLQMRGRHSIKYGFQTEQYQNNFGNLGGNGKYTFNGTFTQGPNPFTTGSGIGYGLADFLLGTFSSGSLNSPDNAANTKRYFAGYVQDDFRITPTLTLNIGLRWEGWQGTTERYNRIIRGWAFDIPNPIRADATAKYTLNPIPELPVDQFSRALTGGLLFADPSNRSSMPGNYRNFSPRFGFAYRLGADTVVRGGWGLFSAFDGWGSGSRTGFAVTSEAVATIDGVTPYNLINNPFPLGFSQPTGSSKGLLTQVGGSVSAQDQNASTQRMSRWNFGVQRQVTANVMVELNYTGTTTFHTTLGNTVPGNGQPTSVTRHFISNDVFTRLGPTGRLNQTLANPFYGIAPANTSLGSTSKISVQNLLSSYPQFSNVTINQVTGGTNYYHSFQTTVNKRISRGFTGLGTYTFSKSLMRRFFLNPGDPGPSKMLAPYDAPHRVTFAGMWQLPFGEGQPWGWKRGPLAHLTGGWQTNAIWTWQSGFLAWLTNPVQATGINAKLTSGRTWEHWVNTAAYVTKPTWALRTASYTDPNVRGGPINNWDLSLFKNFSIRERMTLQFRWEMFNAFNHVEFGAPDMNPTSPTYGCACGLTQGARTMQLGLKLMFGTDGRP